MQLTQSYFTVTDVARHFGISESTITRNIQGHSNSLPGFPKPALISGKGGVTRWHIDQIKAYDKKVIQSAA